MTYITNKMAIIIDNIGALRTEIMNGVKWAIKELSKTMSMDLARTLETKYYQAYTPARDVRTRQLITACTVPKLTFTGSSAELKVFVDTKMMYHRRYGTNGRNGSPITQRTLPSGKSFTEQRLAESAFHGYHGIKGGVVAAKTVDVWEQFEKKWSLSRVESEIKKSLRLLGWTVR